MNIVFLGTTRFSEEILTCLIEHSFKVKLIFSIPSKFRVPYSKTKVTNYNFSDIPALARKYKIRHFEVDSQKGKRLSDHYEQIRNCKPDVIMVAGWYYMVPEKIRDLARYGAWGLHGSLLPKYAGSAPLVWAMIKGEKKTGVTLFKLDNGIDSGDIISQQPFSIGHDDTIKEVYDKATNISKEILVKALKNINRIKFKKQNRKKARIFPPRHPDDGKIDFSKSALEIYNFIRAQSFPYPGAFIRTRDGKKLVIEKCRIE